MKRFELKIEILNQDYIDTLIIALTRQGYAPYIDENNRYIYFEVMDDDLTNLT